MGHGDWGEGYELVRLRSGAWAVRDRRVGEVMHPGGGPEVESCQLYVEQLRLPRLLGCTTGRPVVIWDVGLGAGANALAILRAASAYRVQVYLLSFDLGLAGLRFARSQAERLTYLRGWEWVMDRFLDGKRFEGPVGAAEVRWEFVEGDFTALLAQAGRSWPAPDAVAYDPFSPARNPELWTVEVFDRLRRRLPWDRPCLLATYSRSNRVRMALLLAGFYVGRGRPVDGKEETTVAANRLELLEQPLDQSWLMRLERLRKAEAPERARDCPELFGDRAWKVLLQHPQFAGPF